MKKCIKINKNLAVPAVGILIAGLALFAGRSVQPENGFTLNQYHNADAKFIGDHIITSVDEQIRILDLEGQEVRRFEGTQQLSAAARVVAAPRGRGSLGGAVRAGCFAGEPPCLCGSAARALNGTRVPVQSR